MTSSQLKFYNFMLKYMREEQRPPTVREIRIGMGFKSPRSVSQYLDALEEQNLIRRKVGSRNIRILGYKFVKVLARQSEKEK